MPHRYFTCVCMYVCVRVCAYVCMYVCMYVYECMYVLCTSIGVFQILRFAFFLRRLCMYVCMYEYVLHVYVHICM